MRVHFAGVAGVFMCALAKLAKLAGHQVSGSDKAFYPPGGDMARQLGITLYESYEDAADNCKADVYVIGNAISRGNPLAERILNNGGDYISAPQWLYENVLCKRKVLAVAGTHGKTTTASLLIKLLTAAKMSPGFVIGGASSGGDILAQPGEGEWFVVEADEYDSAFFDKRPKFLHYRPRVAIINNMEFDHADIYDNIGDIIRQFHYLLRSVPANGAVVVNADSDAACKAMQMGIYSPPVWFNAGGKKNNHNWHWHFDGKQMTVFDGGRLRCSLQPPLAGSANRDNITAALAAASFAGVDISCASELLKDYRPPMRRLQTIYDENDILMLDDFAHHPGAYKATIAALREQYPHKRILAVVEAASNSMKAGVFGDTLADSLAAADVVFASDEKLTWDLRKVLSSAKVCDNNDALCKQVADVAQRGDCIVLMSNGAFGGAAQKIISAKLAAANAAVMLSRLALPASGGCKLHRKRPPSNTVICLPSKCQCQL